MTGGRPAKLDPGRLFDLATDLMCTADFEGYLVAVSPSWEAALGWTPDELRSRPFFDFVHPEDVPATEAELARLGQGALTISFENRYRTKSGEWRWLEWNAQPAPDEGVVYAVARDVTERKEIDRLRREFISSVSHELRTPLTSIRGSLGLLQAGASGELPAEAVELIDIATTSTERLIRLINDLLDLERVEAGAAPLLTRPVRVRALLEAAAAELSGIARTDGVTIEIDQDDDDLEFVVDFDRVVQVLVNLLGNALKFSPRGEVITLRARGTGRACRVEVADRGPGVAPALLPRIFERFTQDRGVDGGTGLGLAICRAIVEQHGGRIGAAARDGGGTTFWFELGEAPARGPAVKPHRAASDWDLLIVEDDPQLGPLLASMLEREGYSPRVAPTLAEAFAALEERVPKVVLLDLELRGEPGLQVWEKLRSDPRTRSVPVVLTSGHDPETELERLPLVQAWLKKPFAAPDLLRAVVEAAED